MKHFKWKSKPFAVVRPRRGQKYRVAQVCAAWHSTGRPSIEQLADIFGISPGLIQKALRARRSNGHGNGRARSMENGQHPIVHKQVVDVGNDPVRKDSVVGGKVPVSVDIEQVAPRPVELVGTPDEAWAIARELVARHGVDQVFDALILPAIR